MSRGRSYNATGRARHDTRHVRLHEFLLRSCAYRALSVYARAALVEFYRLYNGQNNGELFLSERKLAEQLGASRKRARKAIQELREMGFITIQVPAGFSRKTRHATCWRLTEFPCDGELPTKDFMRWPTPAVGKNSRVSVGDHTGTRGRPICSESGQNPAPLVSGGYQ